MTYEEFKSALDEFDPAEDCCLEHLLGEDIPEEFYDRYERERS